MSSVYIMHSPGRGMHKIGKADDVESRLRTFKTVDPDMQVQLVIRCKNPFQVESSLHDRFRHKRIWANHEWFSLEEHDIEWIKSNGAKRWRRRNWRKYGDIALYAALIISLAAAFWVAMRYLQMMRIL